MKGLGRLPVVLISVAIAGCSLTAPAAPTVAPITTTTPAPTLTPRAMPVPTSTATATIAPTPTADLSWILEAPSSGIDFRLPLTIRHTGTRSAVLQYVLDEELPSELVLWRARDRAGLRRLSQPDSGGPILVDELEPDTLYEAVVTLGEPARAVWEPWQFINFATRPEGPSSLRVAVFGDSGFGEQVTARLAEAVAAEEVDLVLHTGDVVYRVQEDTDPPSAFLRKLYRPLAPLLQRVPFYPVPGNHEFDAPTYWQDQPYYQGAFPPIDHAELSSPAEGEGLWYAFRVDDIQFIMLNSQSVFGYPGLTEQTAWMKQRIDDPAVRYSIVVSHVPPYSVGRHPTDSAALRAQWGELFASPRVPLVLSGHDHNYQRFEVEDTTFVVSGGGSNVLYSLESSHPALQYGERVTHYVALELGPGEIELRALDLEGRLIDRANIPLLVP